MERRSDIDGLRSIAVVPIVLYHAGVEQLSGGFFGVDIFFVISGFLITSIIQREIEENRFSVADFYRRRIARIFPALLFMLTAVLIAGCALLLPFELEKLGYAAASAAVFAANIWYWAKIDYFGGEAEFDLLLHTWSLGVEEQFYIVYPLLLLGLAHFKNISIRTALVVVIAVSLLFAIFLSWLDEHGSFYLFPARSWQLAAGGLIAVWTPPIQTGRIRSGLAWIGLLLIGLSYMFVSSDSSVPVPWAIFPTIGAALVIAFGRETSADRFLSLAPLQWFGLISYSLYLWHWPIIAFWRIDTGIDLDSTETFGLVLASIIAAAISYYMVETPFLRSLRAKPPWRIILTGSIAALCVVLLALLVAFRPTGWQAIDPETKRVSEFANYVDSPEHTEQFRKGTCFETSTSAPFDYKLCTKLESSAPNVALIGDSHAAQYADALAERLAGTNLAQLTTSSCPVLIGASGPERCTRLTDFTYNEFFQLANIDAVVIGSRWGPDRLSMLDRSLQLLRSKGIEVIVIGPVFEFEGSFPLILARSLQSGDPAQVEALRREGGDALERQLRSLVERRGATYYSARARECDAESCRYMTEDGVPLHFDYGHLTNAGAHYILRDFPNPTALYKDSQTQH